jgi:hypothetical protein
MKITLSKGGTNERKIEVSKIKVPDLWHVALAQEHKEWKEAILECWHLAHDLRDALTAIKKTK